MKTTIKLNLNDYCYVKLTPEGLDLYARRRPTRSVKDVINGWHRFHIYDFMNIFGDTMYVGNPEEMFEYIDSSHIHIGEPPNA